ncbi:hypothetical protein [Mycolicibacterium tokaiense]|uniref:Predicted ATPase n=1 Tax=Mycolicibacterium tokaiense TaxID=39695 RepID=A0A378TFQ8_9MYCO|nr:hypothetical protein [Mycolicibacterium tokaiense]BBY85836.1 hypothetical protein MTOK_16180 [Mycolicibacterium tokaiense]STZ59652.1 Predicted ATPase [Mycolicibacterium tokaiense]
MIASRPRLGRADENAWFAALDSDEATVRATLAANLIDRTDPRAAELCTPLGFYWYFRARVTEGARWLGLARDAAAGHDPAHWVAATVVLASALATQGRVETARPLVKEVLGRLAGLEDEALIVVGEGLIALGGALWVHPDAALITDVHAGLQQIATRSGDPDLQLFTDIQGCSVTALAGRLAEAATRAEELHDEAIAAGNDAAAWLSAATPMTAALLHDDPERGIFWVRKVMRAHVAAGGTSSAGMFIENRANYETQRGSHRQAARLYAAAHTHTRRAPWSGHAALSPPTCSDAHGKLCRAKRLRTHGARARLGNYPTSWPCSESPIHSSGTGSAYTGLRAIRQHTTDTNSLSACGSRLSSQPLRATRVGAKRGHKTENSRDGHPVRTCVSAQVAATGVVIRREKSHRCCVWLILSLSSGFNTVTPQRFTHVRSVLRRVGRCR